MPHLSIFQEHSKVAYEMEIVSLTIKVLLTSLPKERSEEVEQRAKKRVDKTKQLCFSNGVMMIMSNEEMH